MKRYQYIDRLKDHTNQIRIANLMIGADLDLLNYMLSPYYRTTDDKWLFGKAKTDIENDIVFDDFKSDIENDKKFCDNKSYIATYNATISVISDFSEYKKKHFLSENKNFVVYEIYDKRKHIYYIGKANDAYARWIGHLHNASPDWHQDLRSRPEDFYFKVIYEASNEQGAYSMERRLIHQYLDLKKKLYNKELYL